MTELDDVLALDKPGEFVEFVNEAVKYLRANGPAIKDALRDSERLDWLDMQRGDDVQGSFPDEPVLVGHYWSVDGQCHDVRAAIDAAQEVGK